jgi:glycosyltransferase involved in cell wall biosynthesis
VNEVALKVCLVAPHPPPYGGIANWTVLIHRYAQSRRGVVLSEVDISPRWRAMDDRSVWKRALGGSLQLVRDYARFLRVMRERTDVIHLATFGELGISRDLLIMATARREGVPSVYHLHFGRLPRIATENTFEWRMLAKAIRMAHTVIAVDPATVNTINLHLPGTRVLRIPNGIDLADLPQSIPRSSIRTVLYLGWVVPSKGISELVHAWKAITLEGWRCLVVGPGSDAYRKKILKDYEPTNLEFLPEQSHKDALRLLATADVLVLPSHTEGFPNVIVEAMAMGKPIVATSVGAIPEMLADECGVVIPPNDVDALRIALLRVMSDTDLQASRGKRAQRKACIEYTIDKVFEQYLSVWRNAAAAS